MPFFKAKATRASTTTPVATQNFLTPEKIMLAQSPVFGGEKNESFLKFYNHIQMQMIDEPNASKLEFMLLRLYGAAANAFIQIMTQNNSINFDDITKQMKARFPEPHCITLQVLRRRKQLQHETLEDFASSIKELVNKFFTSSRGYNKQARDFQMIKFFLFNVGSPLKQQLKRHQRNFQNLNDVLFKAIQLQQINQSRHVPQITQKMTQLQLQPLHVRPMQHVPHPPVDHQQQQCQNQKYWQGRQ